MRWILDLERRWWRRAVEPASRASSSRQPGLPRPQTVSPSRKRHAKAAALDERTVLVCSADLTTSGITAKLEAGLVVRDGLPPAAPSSNSELSAAKAACPDLTAPRLVPPAPWAPRV